MNKEQGISNVEVQEDDRIFLRGKSLQELERDFHDNEHTYPASRIAAIKERISDLRGYDCDTVRSS